MTSSKKPTCPNPSFPSFFQAGCSVLHVVKTYFLISTYIWMLCEGAYLQVKAILDDKLLPCKYHWNYVYPVSSCCWSTLGVWSVGRLAPWWPWDGPSRPPSSPLTPRKEWKRRLAPETKQAPGNHLETIHKENIEQLLFNDNDVKLNCKIGHSNCKSLSQLSKSQKSTGFEPGLNRFWNGIKPGLNGFWIGLELVKHKAIGQNGFGGSGGWVDWGGRGDKGCQGPNS